MAGRRRLWTFEQKLALVADMEHCTVSRLLRGNVMSAPRCCTHGGASCVMRSKPARRLLATTPCLCLSSARPRSRCPMMGPWRWRSGVRWFGLPTEALIAQVLVAKYADHLPLYRQAQIYARQGIQRDRSTLADWVGREPGIFARCVTICWNGSDDPSGSLPTRPRPPCLIRGAGERRRVSSGLMPAMTGHEAAQPHRWSPTSMPLTARPSARNSILVTLPAFCRSMAMAVTPRLPSAGNSCA